VTTVHYAGFAAGLRRASECATDHLGLWVIYLVGVYPSNTVFTLLYSKHSLYLLIKHLPITGYSLYTTAQIYEFS